jgi:5'-methylthioadenosine phosphorylase
MSSIKVGLIGGTGLGQFIDMLGTARPGQRHEIDTPFGRSSDAIVETEWEGLSLLLLNRHGPGHWLGPSRIPSRANIFALKQLGCTHILASGAVGSLRQEFRPRDLVIPDQVIDKTAGRPATFFEKAAVHVEFAEPFCPILRKLLIEVGGARDSSGAAAPANAPPPSAPPPPAAPATPEPTVHGRGCYVCMEGPAFSTRAESLMHRLWGGDLIGMTALPEAKLAREAEIPYALVALVTDYDCWKPAAPSTGSAAPNPAPDAATLLEEIKSNMHAAADRAGELIQGALARLAADPGLVAECPARQALKWAIWSDRSRIERDEINRLALIWGRYFA